MFILSVFIWSCGLEFWLVHHTSIYESLELNVYENIKSLGEISSNWPNNSLGKNEYKTLESCW